MKDNKNFKRLMIFAIAVTMCMTGFAVLPTASADCPDNCPSGMVSYWKFDEGSGTIAHDSCGTNNGTLEGICTGSPCPPQWTTGKVDDGLQFGGGYVDCKNYPSLDFGDFDALTIEFWAYRTTGGQSYHYRPCIFSQLPDKDWHYTTNQIAFEKEHGNLFWTIVDTGGNEYTLGGVSIPFDEWHHIAVMYDGQEMKIYRDGALANSNNIGSIDLAHADDTVTTNTAIGRAVLYTAHNHGGPHYNPFMGTLDEAAVYNEALTPDEIACHYHAGLAGHGYCCPSCPPEMISYWKLDEGSGTIAYDYYGSNDGTNNGATINQPGQVAKAYSFDGSVTPGINNDYVDCGGDASLAFYADMDMTIEAWINIGKLPTISLYNIINKGGADTEGGGYTFSISHAAKLSFWNRGSGCGILANTPLNANEWYHVAAVYEQGYITFFLNGNCDGKGTPSGTFLNNIGTPLYISAPWYNNGPFNGIIDEVAIYNGVLTADEISYHYHAGLAGHGYCECPDTVYVDDGWTGPGNCGGHTWHYNAFATIQEGVDAVCGSTVYVAAGHYTPPSTLSITTDNLRLLGPNAGVDPRPSYGSSRTPGDTTTEAIIDGGPNGLGRIIYIDADNVEINGLEIKLGTSDMIRQSNSHTGTVVSHCIVHDGNGDEGVQLKQCSNGLMEYNYVYDIAWAGDALNFADSNDCTIQNNEIHDIDSDNAAIYVYGSDNTDIIGNLIYNLQNGEGIKLGTKSGGDASRTGGLISNNVIHDLGGTNNDDGIAVYTSHVTVEGNEIYADTSENGALYLAFAITDISIVHNDIHDNPLLTVKYPDAAGILLGSGVDVANVFIYENNIYGNTPYGISNHNTVSVDATCNWYGDISGPTHSGNPSGSGDVVSDYVTYLPWLDRPYPDGECVGGICVNTVWVDDDEASGWYDWDHVVTIQTGIDRVCEGGIVYVEDGDYYEDVIVHVQDVTVQAVNPPTSTAIIYGTVDITADGVTFENFKVMPTATYTTDEAAIAVYASDIVVNNNTIDGITGDGSNYFTIKGIHVYSSSGINNIDLTNNIIQNVENQGTSTPPYGGADGIMVQGVIDGVNVIGNTVEDIHSAGWAYGIEVTPTGSSPTNPPQNVVIEENHVDFISATTYPGVCLSIDAYFDGFTYYPADASEVTVHCNNFENTPYGAINRDLSHILDAECNWWDDCTGPYNETLNPDGLGCNVLGLIDFDPWVGQVVAEANGPYTAEYDDCTVHFDGSGSTAPICCGGTVKYEWDFDDSDGIQVDSTEQNPTHTYTYHGQDEVTVTLTVTVTVEGLGHVCSDTDTAIVEFIGPNSPPIVQLIYPKDGDTVSGTVTVEWYAISSDYPGESLPMYLYYKPVGVDSIHKIAGPIANTGEYNWNTGSIANGQYVLIVEAVDSGGMGHDSATITVSGGSAGMMVDVQVRDTDIGSTSWVKDGDTVEITAAITGAGASALVAGDITADLSGFGKGTVVANSYNGFEATWTINNVVCTPSDGSITVTVDAKGITTGSATITADNTNPEVTIDKPVNGLYFFNTRLLPLSRTIIIGAITIELDTDDNNGIDRAEFYIDGDLKETDTGGGLFEWYTNLPRGQHNLEIKVYDHAGNKATQSVDILKFL